MTPQETKRLMLIGNATRNQLAIIDAVLEGRTITPNAPMIAEIDRTLTRGQVAEILGCSKRTVSIYARRGLIAPFRTGVKGQRARGYSFRSVKALQERSIATTSSADA